MSRPKEVKRSLTAIFNIITVLLADRGACRVCETSAAVLMKEKKARIRAVESPQNVEYVMKIGPSLDTIVMTDESAKTAISAGQ